MVRNGAITVPELASLPFVATCKVLACAAMVNMRPDRITTNAFLIFLAHLIPSWFFRFGNRFGGKTRLLPEWKRVDRPATVNQITLRAAAGRGGRSYFPPNATRH